MDNSWVKLYRKAADNDVIFDDKALRIFFWLLTQVDKKTGKITVGRFQASQRLRLNSNTFYKALKRLEKKYKIVTLNSNNKFTEISLLNWAKYNPYNNSVTQSGNNKVTTKEQQSNTITRHIDNKTIDNGKPLQDEEINQLITYLKDKLELPLLDDSILSNRRYAHLCIKKFGFEKTKTAIDATAQNKFWHTNVTSFKTLYYNAVKIVTSLRGEVKSIDATKVLDHKNEGREGISIDAGGVRDIKKNISIRA